MKKKLLSVVLTAAVAASLIPVTTKAEGNDNLTGTVYGTTTLSYTEYYQGDTSVEVYDAVTSATTTKNKVLANADSTEPNESGYQILGVKNVPVAVSADVYKKAQELQQAGTLESADAVYQKAAKITLNEKPEEEVAQYKTLKEDGSWSATKQNVVDTVADANPVLKTTSNWGAYEVDVMETSTKYLRNTREDAGFPIGSTIQGIIVETTDNTKVGLRHLEEIWVQPYEFSFNLNTVAANNLVGKTISKVSYIMPEGTYVYTFAEGVYLKPQIPEGNSFAAKMSEDYKSVIVADANLPKDIKNPKVTVYHKEGRSTTYYVQDGAIVNGQVTLETAAVPDTEYTVIVSSDNYADKSVKIAAAPTDISTYKAVLSENTYSYDGTEKKPVVTVEGLTEGTDFVVEYSNNINAGTATVTVIGMGSYTGTITEAFTITSAEEKPNNQTVTVGAVKGLKVKNVSGKKAKITWKKVSDAAGYQIQYSTNKNFKNAQSVTVKKGTKTSQTISKLKAKKKYYVRIRAYKTASSKTYYSAWSGKASVQIKK